MWHNNILEVIGNPPLVRLNKAGRGLRATILAKLASVINNPRPFMRSDNYFGPARGTAGIVRT